MLASMLVSSWSLLCPICPIAISYVCICYCLTCGCYSGCWCRLCCVVALSVCCVSWCDCVRSDSISHLTGHHYPPGRRQNVRAQRTSYCWQDDSLPWRECSVPSTQCPVPSAQCPVRGRTQFWQSPPAGLSVLPRGFSVKYNQSQCEV